MKKFNLEERIKNSKFNTFANFKYFIIAPAVILLVGLILLCTIGFNKSIDFTGGYIAKVYIGSEHTFEEGQDLIESVLTEHNIVASLYQKTEENEEGSYNLQIQTQCKPNRRSKRKCEQRNC